ncbi:MAG TPA: gamma-glutamylcyclotransferase family protein [Yinghuangia sp.]|nr:gamma-glutamylcyclotransferase family protein [Yinghuangia sp.]
MLTALLDRVPDHSAAAVDGWRAAAVPGRVYPVLMPGTGRVPGRLLTGIATSEWQVLDAFEDDLYDIVRLPLVDGGHAWAYVAPSGSENHEPDWSVREFASRHLADYVAACRKWRAGYRASVMR